MQTFHTRITVLAVGVLAGLGVPQPPRAAAEVVIETVPVGNPGNPGEQSRLGNGDATFYGGVGYTFSMGRDEVTAGQYTEFLNAVAATDSHGLYHPWMDYDADPSREGCNIKQHGVPGSHTYSVAPDWANRPVNYVSWADAVRFANWLHNGQPTGSQNLTTTEDGSYFINGIHESNDGDLEDVVRNPDATWVVPTDSEWYKAAYHKNDGVTGNYWNYPTGTDSAALLSNDLVDPDPGHHATYQISGDFTVGSPYWRTAVGAHENSASPYGTLDQGGNVMEFTETVGMIPETRRMRGGSYRMGRPTMSASEIDDVMHSSDQFRDLGFRLANVSGDPGGPICGDAVCEGTESPLTCPADCPDVCGDALCSGDEDPLSCPVDCPDVCGDGLCTGPEGPLTCSFDCPDVCGDGFCTGSENALTCTQDCADVCGDGVCSGPEDTANCPVDCAPVCGDGVVEGDEECEAGVPLADTCQSLGFDQGILACIASTCQYDTSDCSENQCLPRGAFCSQDADCCSGDCRGWFWRWCR